MGTATSANRSETTKMSDCGEPRSGFYADAESGVCYRNLDFMGYPGYRIGDDGSVWSCRNLGGLKGHVGNVPRVGSKWRRLKTALQKTGYHTLMFGDRTTHAVHRLVLIGFTGQPPAGMVACHNDGDSTNNHLRNLRWGTWKSNSADRDRHGTMRRGSSNHRAIATEIAVLKIRRDYASGVKIKVIAANSGLSYGCVWDIVKRRRWVHVS